MKPSFKTHHPDGIESFTHPIPKVSIQLKKRVIGYILPPSWHNMVNTWEVRFAVWCRRPKLRKTRWRWARVRKQFASEEEARDYVKRFFPKLSQMYRFHKFRRDERAYKCPN